MISIETSTIPPDKVLLNKEQFMKLVENARKIEEVIIKEIEFLTTNEIMKMQLDSGAFDFLFDEKEDIYTVNDLKIKYK